MEETTFTDLIKPFSLNENEMAWREQQIELGFHGNALVEASISAFSLASLIQDIKTQYDSNAIWCVSPSVYEQIKLAHLFPEPTRKLRKVQLRRLYARKRRYKQHRACVNAAIQARLACKAEEQR